MPSHQKQDLVDQIGLTIARWQDAVESFDDVVGRQNGLNNADLRCLSFVIQGPRSASAIARETALTPASITALIDRLEDGGWVSRRSDPADRRKVVVEATEKAFKMGSRVYGPIVQAGNALLAGYTIQELKTILHFLGATLALQRRMLESLAENRDD